MNTNYDWLRQTLAGESVQGDPIRFLERCRLSLTQYTAVDRWLKQTPIAINELAERGLLSDLAETTPWPDISTPSKNYTPVRDLVGMALLNRVAAECGLVAASRSILDWCHRLAPIRHVSLGLAADLRDATPVLPWPTMRAPYSVGLLVMLPSGVLTINDTDPGAAMGLEFDDTAQGLRLRSTLWGKFSGCSETSWEAAPDPANNLSRLAWGITGLLCSEPQLVEIDTPQSATGKIRNKAQRPGPSWIAPPVRYVRHQPDDGISIRGPVRGHWRRAHLHRYRCGPKRKQLIEHWRPAEWVGGSED